jgi:excisionase family DNA binding protein
MTKLLYTIPEAAEALGLSRHTVKKHCYSDVIKSTTIGGSRRIHLDEIERIAREGAGKPRKAS